MNKEESVKACALFLDGIRPGWEHEVDPDEINFNSNQRCVVGQIWGHVRFCSHWEDIAQQFPLAILGGTVYWEKEIAARRAAPSSFPEEWTKTSPLVVR